MLWTILVSAILSFGISTAFFLFYLKRSTSVDKQVDIIVKKLIYMHELFDQHFKTTDKTITDLRKERDELKIELAKLK